MSERGCKSTRRANDGMKKPCLDCQDRHIGCHSKCDNYQDSLKQYDKSKYEYMAYKRDVITREIKGGRR